MNLQNRVDEILEEIIEIRRDFHKYPELSEMEYRTCDKICEYLTRWEIEHIKGVAKTGVVAIIRGKGLGKTIGLRADIDALPVTEINGLSYKSVNKGVMHACGHDFHMAIHLGVAKILKDMEDNISGNVKIFFQPAEETIGGAEIMIKEGCLENPKVDYVLALHLMSNVEVGEVELKYGKLNAATNEFSIEISGVSSHAAYPEQSIDPIVTAAYVITNLQTLVSRNISPLNSVVLTLGQINGGTKNNVIPNTVTLSGTLRTLDPDTRIYAKKRIEEIVEYTSKSFGALGVVKYEEGYPALINNDEVVDILKETAEDILGKHNVKFKEFPSMGADDFSYFLDKVKGAYYNLGCGNKEKGWKAPLHSEYFMPDEGCISIGMNLQLNTILNLLNKTLD